jgi:hypothetical protein
MFRPTQVRPSLGGVITCSRTPAPPTSGFEAVIQNISVGIAALSGTGMPTSVALILNTSGSQFYPVLPFALQGPGFWALTQPTTQSWVGTSITAKCLEITD